MGKNKILNRKKVDKAILEIKNLQQKYSSPDTIIVYHALDTALNQLGWDYAGLLEKGN
jgi:hypothetical protein